MISPIRHSPGIYKNLTAFTNRTTTVNARTVRFTIARYSLVSSAGKTSNIPAMVSAVDLPNDTRKSCQLYCFDSMY